MATVLKGIEEVLAELPQTELGKSAEILFLGLRSRDLIFALEQKLEALGVSQHKSLILAPQATSLKGWQKVARGDSVELKTLPEILAMEGEKFDWAVVMPSKDRDLTNAWADSALSQLKVGGFLLLAGDKREGIEPLEKRVKAKTEMLARQAVRSLGRVSLYKKTSATPQPKLEELWNGFEVELGSLRLPIKTLPGVFGKKGFDEGTRLLLNAIETHPGERVLDLACGAGTVGLTLLKKEPSLRLTFSDDDATSIACVGENAKALGLAAEKIVCADGMEALKDEKFDLICLNPPFHSGQGVNYVIAERLCKEASRALNPNGRFYMVANAQCPYEEFLSKFWNTVEPLHKDKHFKVWKCS